MNNQVYKNYFFEDHYKNDIKFNVLFSNNFIKFLIKNFKFKILKTIREL